MNIHPLWCICIIIRISIIFSIQYSYKIHWILLLIGCGFLYKAITGSNNEHQIARVFWHSSRIIHTIMFLSAGASLLFLKNKLLCQIILLGDILVSILYRIMHNV